MTILRKPEVQNIYASCFTKGKNAIASTHAMPPFLSKIAMPQLKP